VYEELEVVDGGIGTIDVVVHNSTVMRSSSVAQLSS
jgi:hypothetical protein